MLRTSAQGQRQYRDNPLAPPGEFAGGNGMSDLHSIPTYPVQSMQQYFYAQPLRCMPFGNFAAPGTQYYGAVSNAPSQPMLVEGQQPGAILCSGQHWRPGSLNAAVAVTHRSSPIETNIAHMPSENSLALLNELPDDLFDLIQHENVGVDEIDEFLANAYGDTVPAGTAVSSIAQNHAMESSRSSGELQLARSGLSTTSGRVDRAFAAQSLLAYKQDQKLSTRVLRAKLKRKIPPLVKEDLRRRYMSMFANVWNSHDELLISDFMVKYCVNNCFMVNECPHANALHLPPRLELLGLQPIFEFWHGRMILFPDAIFEVINVKVRSKYRPENLEFIGSVIEARIAVSGTQLYEINLDDWMPSMKKNKRKVLSSAAGEGTEAENVSCDNSSSISTDEEESDSSINVKKRKRNNSAGSEHVLNSHTNAQADERGTFLALDDDDEHDALDDDGRILKRCKTGGEADIPPQMRNPYTKSDIIHVASKSSISDLSDRTIQLHKKEIDASREQLRRLHETQKKLKKAHLLRTEESSSMDQVSLLEFCRLVKKPERMTMRGMMMIHVDSQLRIQRFDFLGDRRPRKEEDSEKLAAL